MTSPSRFERLLVELATACANLPLERVTWGVERVLAETARYVDAEKGWVAVSQHQTNRSWCVVSYWTSTPCEGGPAAPPQPVVDQLALYLTRTTGVQVLGPAELQEVFHLGDAGAPKVAPCSHDLVATQVLHPNELTVQLALCCPFGWRFPRNPRELDLVRVAGEIIANALRHRGQQERTRIGYRALHQTADMIIVTDRDEVIQWVNPAFELFTGFSLIEALGATPRILRSGVHDAAFYADLRERMRQGEPFRGEIINRKKDGTFYVEEKVISPVRDDRGTVTHFVSTGRDITARRELDDALRASERSLRQAQQIAGLGSWEWQPDPAAWDRGGVVTWSEQTRRIFSLPDGEPVPAYRDFLEHVHAEDRTRVHEAFGSSLATGRPFCVDHRLIDRDGCERFVEVRAEVEVGSDGRAIRMVGTVRDVTAERLAERRQGELQAEVHRRAVEWQQTFDCFDFPVLVVEPGGTIHRLNRAARDLIGGSYRANLGRQLTSLPAEEPWVSAAEMVAAADHDVAFTPRRRQGKSGCDTWEIAGRTMGSGEERKVLLVLRDVSATVRLEEELRRADLLAQMGALVAGVAHEVRNPLFGISATLDAFESRFGGGGQFQPYLSVLRGELDRLSALMQDLLDYGKPASRERTNTDLGELAERVVESFLAEARGRGLEIRFDRPSLAPLHLDRRRIELAIRNLIANALDHTQVGSSVLVLLRREQREASKWVVLTVLDHGPGFRPEDLARLPEPFLSGRVGGTGLGLAIVQRVADEHGGRLVLANSESGGASASLELPVA